jgi:hypothetical protein
MHERVPFKKLPLDIQTFLFWLYLWAFILGGVGVTMCMIGLLIYWHSL